MNIDWDNKPEWAIGAGYSTNHHLWLWFDHSHYQMPFGDARFPFNTSFSKNDMTDIQYPPAKGWNAEGLPLIGEECKLKPYWHKVTIIAHHDSDEGTRIVFWDHHALVYGYSHRPDYFRTFKSAREQWANQAIRIYDEKDEGARENFARLYDAMQTGILSTPKGDNIDLTGVAALDALYDAMVSGEQPYKR